MSLLVTVLLIVAIGLVISLAVAVEEASQAHVGRKIAEDRLYDLQRRMEAMVESSEVDQ